MLSISIHSFKDPSFLHQHVANKQYAQYALYVCHMHLCTAIAALQGSRGIPMMTPVFARTGKWMSA